MHQLPIGYVFNTKLSIFNSNYILAKFQLPVFFGREAQEQALEAQEQALEEQVLEVLAQRCFHYYRW